MLGKVFKAYDIRAMYPKPLSAKLAWQIGYGAAQHLIQQAERAGHDDPMMRHIVVGRDMRISSPELCTALKKGIRDFGASVIDVGLVDTPFIYFAINYLCCCGGVQTTASHNPAHYNGFKISKIAAKPVGMTTGLDDIRRFALLDGSRKLKVVIDASNGMAGTAAPKLFDDVPGLEIIKLNFDNSTGEFVHEPNPLVEANLQQLREIVRSERADLGICFDGDADRCIVMRTRTSSVAIFSPHGLRSAISSESRARRSCLI